MEAKTKAKNLVEKFQNIDQPEGWDQISETTAIECARVCVEEIKSVLYHLDLDQRTLGIYNQTAYWDNVKSELEKM